jgi:outer membrane murein-binding lipoprotein Lpp
MGKAKLAILGASVLGLCVVAGCLMLRKESNIRKIACNLGSMLETFTDDEIV